MLRPPRPLFERALAIAGRDGAGRSALDIGCGSGVETLALLDLGWRVTAFDSDDTAAAAITTAAAGGQPGVFRHADLSTVSQFPAADLIYSGYAMSYLGIALPAVWRALVAALRPGGVIAVDLFGDHDELVDEPGVACLTQEQVFELVADLQVLDLRVEDAPGQSFTGPKHWHVFQLIARRK